MTVFLVVLMIAAILLAVLPSVLRPWPQHPVWTAERRVHCCWRYRYPSFVRAWLLRIVSMVRRPCNHIHLRLALVPDRIHSQWQYLRSISGR